MNWPAAPASTSTSHRAACTTFRVVTTRSAPHTMNAATTPKPMFSATLIDTCEFAAANTRLTSTLPAHRRRRPWPRPPDAEGQHGGAPRRRVGGSSRDLLQLRLRPGLVRLEV